VYGKTALGGEGIGFGKVSGDFSWQTGSVSDIKGTGGEMNIHSGVHGVFFSNLTSRNIKHPCQENKIAENDPVAIKIKNNVL
jgi:hypothetical protein